MVHTTVAAYVAATIPIGQLNVLLVWADSNYGYIVRNLMIYGGLKELYRREAHGHTIVTMANQTFRKLKLPQLHVTPVSSLLESFTAASDTHST